MSRTKSLITLVITITILLSSSLRSQDTNSKYLFVKKNDFLTSLSIGYLGSERDRGFNREFEKSLKNFEISFQSTYMLSERIGVIAEISSFRLGRQFIDTSDSYSEFNTYREVTSSIQYGFGIGYFQPIMLSDKAMNLFIEGGIFRITDKYEVDMFGTDLNSDATGFTISTGLLIPLSRSIHVNMKLRHETYPEDYFFGSVVDDELVITQVEEKWPSETSLNFGFTVRF